MIFVRLAPVRRRRPACREPPPERLGLWVPLRVEFDIYVRGFRASGDRWPRPRRGASGRESGVPDWDDRSRGRTIRCALADARTAEAIVPAIEADDRYPGRRPPGATEVAGSRCCHCDHPLICRPAIAFAERTRELARRTRRRRFRSPPASSDSSLTAPGY